MAWEDEHPEAVAEELRILRDAAAGIPQKSKRVETTPQQEPQHVAPEKVDEVRRRVIERERIRKHKEARDPQPWTTDPMLGPYKFTNVRPKDDYTNKWA